MITVKALMDWLTTLPEDSYVGIDEGGLTLQWAQDDRMYLEVGGVVADTRQGVERTIRTALEEAADFTALEAADEVGLEIVDESDETGARRPH